jgi:hypothetical protein
LGFLSGVALFWVSWDTKWDIISGLYRFGSLPDGDFNWATLAAFAAIAGAGGLSNLAFSNYTRDKGWGMGSQVGAIPERRGRKNHYVVSHREGFRDQLNQVWFSGKAGCGTSGAIKLCSWAPACTIGVALPAMISYEYIRGVKYVDGNGAAQ